MDFNNYENDKYIWDSPSFPHKVNPEEDIILLVRQDAAVLVLKFVGYLVIIVAVILLRLVFTFIELGQNTLLTNGLNTFTYAMILISVIGFINFFHNFYLSVQLVTTDRIIDIDQRGLFSREVNELAIDNVQDVTYKQEGALQHFLGFGNVIVKTAGSEHNTDANSNTAGFVFENCSNPSRVASIISDMFHKKQEVNVLNTAITNAEELRKVLENNHQVKNDYTNNQQ